MEENLRGKIIWFSQKAKGSNTEIKYNSFPPHLNNIMYYSETNR